MQFKGTRLQYHLSFWDLLLGGAARQLTLRLETGLPSKALLLLKKSGVGFDLVGAI